MCVLSQQSDATSRQLNASFKVEDASLGEDFVEYFKESLEDLGLL